MATSILSPANSVRKSDVVALRVSGTQTHTVEKLGVITIALFVSLWNLGDFRTYGSHEVFIAVSAQNMIDSGDWIVPRVAEQPRLKKPPLGYWITAAISYYSGNVTHLTSRLPQAFAAIGLAALMGIWVGKHFGAYAGWLAVLIQATSPYSVIFGRQNTVDMTLCLVTTGIMYMALEAPRFQKWKASQGWYLGLWTLVSIAWMLKFHYGPALTLAPIGLWLLVERRWKEILFFLNPAGILLFLAAVFVWPMLVLQQVPNAWEVWSTETVGRAVGELSRDPVWYYIPHLFTLTLPWCLWAVPAIPESFRLAWKEADSRHRFLWIWLGTAFVVISAQPDKHQAYLLVCLPVLTFLSAPSLANFIQRLRKLHITDRHHHGIAMGCLGLATCIVLAATYVIPMKWPETRGALVNIAWIAGGFSILGGAFFLLKKPLAGRISLCLCFLVCYSATMSTVSHARDFRVVIVEFAESVRSKFPDQRIVLASESLGTAGVAYYAEYIGAPVTAVDNVESISTYATNHSEAIVLSINQLPGRVLGKHTVLMQHDTLPLFVTKVTSAE